MSLPISCDVHLCRCNVVAMLFQCRCQVGGMSLPCLCLLVAMPMLCCYAGAGGSLMGAGRGGGGLPRVSSAQSVGARGVPQAHAAEECRLSTATCRTDPSSLAPPPVGAWRVYSRGVGFLEPGPVSFGVSLGGRSGCPTGRRTGPTALGGRAVRERMSGMRSKDARAKSLQSSRNERAAIDFMPDAHADGVLMVAYCSETGPICAPPSRRLASRRFGPEDDGTDDSTGRRPCPHCVHLRRPRRPLRRGPLLRSQPF